jgi:hypothetical protein
MVALEVQRHRAEISPGKMGCADVLAHLPDQCPASDRACRRDPGRRATGANPSVPLSLASTRVACARAPVWVSRGASPRPGRAAVDAATAVAPDGSPNFVRCSFRLGPALPTLEAADGPAPRRPRIAVLRGPRGPGAAPAFHSSFTTWPSRLDASAAYWHASQVGSSIAQNFGATSSCTADLPGIAAAPPAAPIDDDTALSSPPRPVDFSAEVAASVRR